METRGFKVEQELGGARNKTLRENEIQSQNEGLSLEEVFGGKKDFGGDRT